MLTLVYHLTTTFSMLQLPGNRLYSPHFPSTSSLKCFHQDGECDGEDVLEMHRARNRAPRAPTLGDLQDFTSNEFSENHYKSEADNSDKETDEDAPKSRAPRNSKGNMIIKPTTLRYYSGVQGWQTVLISAKRRFALYVTTANAFPVCTNDLESADKILASVIIAFEGKGGIIDDGLGFIITVLLPYSSIFSSAYEQTRDMNIVV
jgi:hypothetical protein